MDTRDELEKKLYEEYIKISYVLYSENQWGADTVEIIGRAFITDHKLKVKGRARQGLSNAGAAYDSGRPYLGNACWSEESDFPFTLKEETSFNYECDKLETKWYIMRNKPEWEGGGEEDMVDYEILEEHEYIKLLSDIDKQKKKEKVTERPCKRRRRKFKF